MAKNLSQLNAFDADTVKPTFTQPVPDNMAAIMAMLAPYLQQMAQNQAQGPSNLVRGLQTLRGGGHRDSLTGAIMPMDPLEAQREHDQYFYNQFSSPDERISKERERFKTPSDIPTFTEQELAGVNQRARNILGSRGQTSGGSAPPAASPPQGGGGGLLGSPAPTPATKRVAPGGKPKPAGGLVTKGPPMPDIHTPKVTPQLPPNAMGGSDGSPAPTSMPSPTPQMFAGSSGYPAATPTPASQPGPSGYPASPTPGPTFAGALPGMIPTLPELVSMLGRPPLGRMAADIISPRMQQSGVGVGTPEVALGNPLLQNVMGGPPATPNPYAAMTGGPTGTRSYQMMEPNLPTFLEALGGLIPPPAAPNPYAVGQPPTPQRRYLGGY